MCLLIKYCLLYLEENRFPLKQVRPRSEDIWLPPDPSHNAAPLELGFVTAASAPKNSSVWHGGTQLEVIREDKHLRLQRQAVQRVHQPAVQKLIDSCCLNISLLYELQQARCEVEVSQEPTVSPGEGLAEGEGLGARGS